MTPALKLVVLTEDGGTSGWEPVATLVRSLCDRLVAGVDWSRVEVLPRDDAKSGVLRAMAANRWKGMDASGHDLRLTLTGYIANQLLDRDGEPRFVFFHVDADHRWADGGPDQSENVTKFRKLIEHGVRARLVGALTKLGRGGEVDAHMARLHLVVPCWSIESWLYQSTTHAASLCRDRPCAGAHVRHYEAWAAARTVLDDIERPKARRDLHCLDDSDKLALARAFPAAEVEAAGRSFASAVAGAGVDGALLNALIATGRR